MLRQDLQLLGTPQITWVTGTPPRFRSQRTVALLGYLVGRGQPLTRNHLATFFWPDEPPAKGKANLRRELHNLTQLLPDCWQIDKVQVCFVATAVTHIDLNSIQQHEQAREWQAAADLLRGEFLEGITFVDNLEFETWLWGEREHWRQRAAQILENAADELEIQGAYRRALHYARRLVQLTPWHEAAHCQIMQLQALNSQRSAALKQFEICKQVLWEELGVEPSQTTTALYTRIKKSPHFLRDNIPAVTTPLIGRERELANITAMLADPTVRLVTITGIGGSGKTRLALSVAHQHTANQYRDGVTFVSLVALESGTQIITAVAQALHLAPAAQDQRSSSQQLLDSLKAKNVLLILDNCEHLLDSLDIITDILQTAPQVHILATSRERLRLRDEFVLMLQGLDYTDDSGNHPAAQMFANAAQRVVPAYVITEQAAPHVNRLCKMVDGMPLALELAAAWLDTLPPAAIVSQIENSLDLLAANSRDMPQRHRSMRAVLDATWQRLPPATQQLFAALSVFRGTFSREAAEVIADATPRLLAQLVAHSLLKLNQENGRYHLHELVHQYAAAKLSTEQNVKRHRRHLVYFADIVDERRAQKSDAQKMVGAALWEADFSNIQVALDWALADTKSVTEGLKLAGALYDFWWFQGHLTEGHHWLTTLFRQDKAGCPLLIQAQALHTLGCIENFLSRNYVAGIAYCRQSLAIYKQLADRSGQIRVLCSVGQIERHHNNLTAAESCYQQALTLARQLGDLWGQSTALHGLGALALIWKELAAAHEFITQGLSYAKQLGNNERIVHHYLVLGMIAMEQQQWVAGRSWCEQALQLHRESGDRNGEQSALTLLGDIARIEQDYEHASQLYRQSLNIVRGQGATWGISVALFNLGQTDLMRDDVQSAHTRLLEGFTLARQIEDVILVQTFVDAFANLAASQNQPRYAAMLWGAAEAARVASDDDFDIADRLQHEHFVAAARAEIDEVDFQNAWLSGRRMTLEQASELMLKWVRW